ncbi:MAG: O-antigen ligase family protein [Deltaproteobacteria bacterium]
MDEFLWYSGFNFSRTGWSVSLSLFVPMAIILFGEKKKMTSINFLYYIILVSPIVSAQAVSGGRGGLLASLISIIITFIAYFGLKYLIVFFTSAYFIINQFKEEVFIAMRIYDTSGGTNTVEDISSYRLSQFRIFNELVNDKPIFGWGYKGSEAGIFQYTGNQFEMHNSVLRVIVDHGIVFGSIVVLLVIYIFYISIKLLRIKQVPRLILVNSCILISVLLASMFEPNVIFGGFQLCAFWWVALGYNLKFYKLNF